MAPDESPAEGLLSLAERLARETGELILAGRSKGIVDVDTTSTGTDMVTEFDRAAETLIVSELRRLRPDDAIVGEEGTNRPGTSGIAWLIDPIDGTTNFLYGLPGYAVSIAASDGDGPLVGAVAVPTFGEVFTARRRRTRSPPGPHPARSGCCTTGARRCTGPRRLAAP